MMKASYIEDKENISEKPIRQQVGRHILLSLARQHQSDLDELILVAAAFGLEASAVAEAIAAEPQPGGFELALAC